MTFSDLMRTKYDTTPVDESIRRLADNINTLPRRNGAGLWRHFQSSSDDALVAEAERNPFFRTRDLKDATGFNRQKDTIISRLNAGLSARHAAVRQLLTHEHKLHHFAFAESNVDCKRDSHIHR